MSIKLRGKTEVKRVRFTVLMKWDTYKRIKAVAVSDARTMSYEVNKRLDASVEGEPES